jgi:hypothetical protein
MPATRGLGTGICSHMSLMENRSALPDVTRGGSRRDFPHELPNTTGRLICVGTALERFNQGSAGVQAGPCHVFRKAPQ